MTNTKNPGQYTAEQIEAIGGRRWTGRGGSLVRVYLNDWHELAGFEVEQYGTGNIRSASLLGESLSNSVATKLTAAKVWLEDGTIRTTLDGDELRHQVGRYGVAMDDVIAKLHASIAERVARSS